MQRFAGSVQRQFLKADVLPILKTLAADDLDSMRVFTSDCCEFGLDLCHLVVLRCCACVGRECGAIVLTWVVAIVHTHRRCAGVQGRPDRVCEHDHPGH